MVRPSLTTHSPSRRPSAGRSVTPISFVHAILEAYRRRNVDPTELLEKAQIATSTLKNPDARITAAQMERISGAAMQELDDEALGWFSRRLPWGSYGMLARASITSANLERALKRWCRHHGLLTEDLTLRLTQSGGNATLSITENRDLGELREFCLVSMLRNIYGVACWLLDSRLPLQGAYFPFPEPLHSDVYNVLFPGSITFDAEFSCIRFDSGYLAMPLRRNELALQKMLQHALPLTVLPYRRDRILAQRVRQVLGHHSSQIHNATTLASLLNVSVRTLHRQLSDEGTSLQVLKDEARQARASELLLNSTRLIKQIAESAGFRNEKSFIRAFRSWTGVTPAEYRKQSLNFI